MSVLAVREEAYKTGYKMDESLGARIREAMAEFEGCAPVDVMFQENKEKYYNPAAPQTADQDLVEVFEIMRNLNQQAIDNPALCCGDGEMCFSEALAATVDSFADLHRGRDIHYVELGPEPVKTSFILSRLMQRGVGVSRYCGVDINPASVARMRDSLSRMLPAERIHQRVSSFEDFRVDQVREQETPALVTMMGFQEGNEESSIMAGWLGELSSRGDYLLSEMQVMSHSTQPTVAAFYSHPLMRRFSRIAFRRAVDERPSDYRAVVLPVTQNDGRVVDAVVLAEVFCADSGAKRILVTNYCLKYTHKQYNDHRVQGGKFTVKQENKTGDGSVLFQLSERQ